MTVYQSLPTSAPIAPDQTEIRVDGLESVGMPVGDHALLAMRDTCVWNGLSGLSSLSGQLVYLVYLVGSA